MRRQAPHVRRAPAVARRHGIVVSSAAAVSMLAGAATAAFVPPAVTSTATVLLASSSPGAAGAAVIAGSDPVLVGALPRVSPAISLSALRGELRVKSITRRVLLVSARAGTAWQTEATANAVAESFIGYVSSASSPAGRAPAQMLDPATRATGTAAWPRLLAGALLGLVSGVLTGVFASFASSRMARGPLADFRGFSSRHYGQDRDETLNQPFRHGPGYPRRMPGSGRLENIGSEARPPTITAGPRAFSRTSLVAQRDAGIGETDAPGSRIPPRPGGLGRGGQLRRVPRHARLPGSGPLDDPGLVPSSSPGSRSRTSAASGSSRPGSRHSPIAP